MAPNMYSIQVGAQPFAPVPPAIIVLFDFHWFRRARVVDGVRTGGRCAQAAVPALRARLLEHAVDPLLCRYGRHPAIAAWDVNNEPEWATRGLRLPPRQSEVPRQAMRAFIRETVTIIHQRTSDAATVGSASVRTLPLVEGLGLDVYQAHWYDRLDRKAPLGRPVASLGLDRPLILGEFPTRGSRRTAAEIVETARRAGYAGALAWSALAYYQRQTKCTAGRASSVLFALGLLFRCSTASHPRVRPRLGLRAW